MGYSTESGSGGGAPGAPGAPGAQGTAGIPGLIGEDGETFFGVPGTAGTAGTAGTTGDPGAQGTAGVPGVFGEDGDSFYGVPGERGAQGVAGNDGAAGAAGATGVGIPGMPGEDGDSQMYVPPSRVTYDHVHDTAAGQGGSSLDVNSLVVEVGADWNGYLKLPVAAVPAQTTEGRIAWDSNDDRLTVGDSAATQIIMGWNMWTAKGMIMAATAASAPVGVAVGTDGQALVADSTVAAGVKWGTAAAGSPAYTNVVKDLGASRSAGTFDITGLSGLSANKPVVIFQSASAITSKGDARDEAEMDHISVTGYVVDATTIRCYWNAPSVVVGSYEFEYTSGG